MPFAPRYAPVRANVLNPSVSESPTSSYVIVASSKSNSPPQRMSTVVVSVVPDTVPVPIALAGRRHRPVSAGRPAEHP